MFTGSDADTQAPFNLEGIDCKVYTDSGQVYLLKDVDDYGWFPEFALNIHSKATTPWPFFGFLDLIKPKSNRVSNISQSTLHLIPPPGIGTLE